MIVHSQHRSFALAERKRRRLERSTGLKWKIIARRNRRGRFSVRGQQFTFKSKKKRKARGAQIVVFYPGKKKGFSITLNTQLQEGESLSTPKGKEKLLDRLLPLFDKGAFDGQAGQEDLAWVASVPVSVRTLERRDDAPEKPEVEDFTRNS